MGGDGVGGDAGEQVGSVGAAHLGADLVCWPAVGGLAPGGQKQHLITDARWVRQWVTTSTRYAVAHTTIAAARRRYESPRRVRTFTSLKGVGEGHVYTSVTEKRGDFDDEP